MSKRLVAALLLAAPLMGGCGPRVKVSAWVVRDAILTPQAVAQVCEQAESADLDSLLVQVRGRGDAYYATKLAPRAAELNNSPTAFDPLREVLDKCGKRTVTAWINAFYLWGSDKPPQAADHVVNAHPDWLLKDADGRAVETYTQEEKARGWIEGSYADPASEGYRAHLAAVAAELVRNYGIEGIHLDFIRYPGPDYGRGGALAKKFEGRFGFDPRWLPTGFGSLNPEELFSDEVDPGRRVLQTGLLYWDAMRAGEVEKTVAAVRDAIRAQRATARLSAAVFPDASPAYLEKGQDWRSWAREGLVDELYPMSYFGGAERVGAQLSAIASEPYPQGAGTRFWAGLGAYLKEPAEIGAEAATARAEGFYGICLFDLGSMKKKAGLKAYVQKVRGYSSSLPGRHELGTNLPTEGLARDYARAGEQVQAPGPGELEKLASREREFGEAASKTIPALLARYAREGVKTPPWREARGIFRFIHEKDGLKRKESQLDLCRQARDRIIAGEEFGKVAAQLSQDGTKNYGGRQGVIYIGRGGPSDLALGATGVGGVTEVVAERNGCWVYRVDRAGEGGTKPLEEVEWAARRVALLTDLSAGPAKTGAGAVK